MIKEIRYCKIKELPSYYRFINEKDEEIYIYFDYIAGLIFFKTLNFHFKGKVLRIGGNNNFRLSIKKEIKIDEYEFFFNETIKKEFKEIKIQCDTVITQWYKELVKITNENDIKRICLKEFINFYHELNKIGGD